MTDAKGPISLKLGIMLLTPAVLLLVLGLLGCRATGVHDIDSSSNSGAHDTLPSESSVVPGQGMSLGAENYAQPTLEYRIFLSDVIARASMIAVVPDVETLSDADGSIFGYLSGQFFTFHVHEYLKGEGADEIVVRAIGDRFYQSKEEAMVAAKATLEEEIGQRDESIIFLRYLPSFLAYFGHEGVGTTIAESTIDAASEIDEFYFTDAVWPAGFLYEVDTLNPVWLPIHKLDSAKGTEDLDARRFMAGSSESGRSTGVTLGDIRSRIVEVENLLAKGDGSSEYRRCINLMFRNEMFLRDYEAFHGRAWSPRVYDREIWSGMPAGSLPQPSPHRLNYGDSGYDNYIIRGPDQELFTHLILDDDDDSTNGYRVDLVTTRPLPAGTYSISSYLQHPWDLPCNFVPSTYIIFSVDVSSPDDVVYEAFFDPAEVNGRIGFGEGGLLKPSGFSIGAAATITALQWHDDAIALTVSPPVPLTQHILEFLALDGSIALTLSGSDAVATDGALTWAVANQPWSDGDELMLRIRRGDTASRRQSP